MDSKTTDKTNSKPELDPEKLDSLNKIAEFVVKKDLATVAILTIESLRPLHFLGSQLILFFEPFLSILGSPKKIELFRLAIEETRYVDYLLNKIEELEGE